MGARALLVCSILLLLIAHVGLLRWNASNDYKEKAEQHVTSRDYYGRPSSYSSPDDAFVMGSLAVVFWSAVYELVVIVAILNQQRGIYWSTMKKRVGYSRFWRYVLRVWLLAAFGSAMMAPARFCSFGAYFLLNALVTAHMLHVFRRSIKKYEKFIERTLQTNVSEGRQLTKDDAHALYELVGYLHDLSSPSIFDPVCFVRSWLASEANQFVKISCWIHKFEVHREALASKEPEMAVALLPVIAQMRARSEQYDVPNQTREQFRRLIQLGCVTVHSGEGNQTSVEVRTEPLPAHVQQQRETPSAPFNEPPPKYEQTAVNIG
ncbi:hypothetical protein M3Y99_01401000 [Aphelenchoides fujianensis]|nr:hypothetical protein M3Y99_01401000 [Aphelenchoides fujianensis]